MIFTHLCFILGFTSLFPHFAHSYFLVLADAKFSSQCSLCLSSTSTKQKGFSQMSHLYFAPRA